MNFLGLEYPSVAICFKPFAKQPCLCAREIIRNLRAACFASRQRQWSTEMVFTGQMSGKTVESMAQVAGGT